MYMYELLLFVITGRPNLVKPGAGASIGRGGKNQPFSRFKSQYLENGRRYV